MNYSQQEEAVSRQTAKDEAPASKLSIVNAKESSQAQEPEPFELPHRRVKYLCEAMRTLMAKPCHFDAHTNVGGCACRGDY